MELDALPKHLLIMGGGYIAIEFGQMFRRYGSQVTIIERREQLLAREDSDVAEEVYKILREDGIDVRLTAGASRVETTEQGEIQLTVSSDGGEATVKGSHLLIATGRRPNADHLNLDAAGVEVDEKGFVKVNQRLETNVPGIYAIGDIKPGPAFTHISYDDFRIIQANLLQNGNARIDGRPVPYTIFMDPQLGRVGLTEKEARAGPFDSCRQTVDGQCGTRHRVWRNPRPHEGNRRCRHESDFRLRDPWHGRRGSDDGIAGRHDGKVALYRYSRRYLCPSHAG